MPDTRLYLLTPPTVDDTFPERLAAALDAGDIAALQIRLKPVTEDALRRAIDRLRPIAQSRGVALILNDRPDLALQTGCDGAHVGEDDMSVAEARRVLGPDLQLGASCYDSRDLALRAGEAGADYVAFGAFFPSGTKAAKTRAEPGLLGWWSELMELPCVAIGGITPENCGPVVRAGADFLAVSAAVWSHPAGPASSVRAFTMAIQAAQDEDMFASEKKSKNTFET